MSAAFDLSETARRVRALGSDMGMPTIGASAALYIPFHESEPYRGVQLTRDISYGADARNRLDVFRPDGATASARPVVMFVHGGGFTMGDKKNPGSPYNDNVPLWAARHGLIGVNMTYRLAPQHPWPAGAEDVAASLAWVRRNIGGYGGDARRIFVLGTSAGAVHVASYLTYSQFQPKEGPGIAGCVLYSGLYNLSTIEIGDNHRAYFGSGDELYRRSYLVDGVARTAVPLMLVLTECDPAFFHAQALEVVAACVKEHGRWPRFVLMQGHNHFTSTMHMNTPDDELGRQILEFVQCSS
jgi:triacylglycerol lipase